MRILFVLSRVPYPLEKGDKLRAFHLIRELSQRHEVFLFCLADERIHERAEAELKRYCNEVYIHRIPLLTRLWKLFLGIFSTLPFQVSYFYSNQAQQKFNAFLEENIPQHIFCQLVRTAEFAIPFSTIPKTLDYMDAFSAGMAKMATRSKWPMSWIMRTEAMRLKQYELEVAPHFKHHTIISAQDAACLPLDSTLEVLPNGVDPIYFEKVTVSKTRDLLFAGNMSYRPNVESARFLVEEVMPRVWENFPDMKLTLAGANPNSLVQSLGQPRVEVTGWVDDIREVYHSSRIFVAPMLINSGLQNKLLEAMACGLPCITSTLANNALGATHQENIMIADDADRIAQTITQLYSNTDESEAISAAGRSFITENYSWEKEAQRLERILKLSP